MRIMSCQLEVSRYVCIDSNELCFFLFIEIEKDN